MKLSTALRIARARIEDPARWWPGGGWKRGDRECAITATAASNLCSHWDCSDALNETAEDHWGTDAVMVNDKLGHAAVMALYDIAISRALSDEASA